MAEAEAKGFMFYVYFEKSQIRIENDSAGPNNAIQYCRLQTLPCCSWENENEVDIKNSLKTSVCSPNRI